MVATLGGIGTKPGGSLVALLLGLPCVILGKVIYAYSPTSLFTLGFFFFVTSRNSLPNMQEDVKAMRHPD